MSYLTDQERDAMRATISEGVLPDTCNILFPTYTSDGQAGKITTWGTATGGTAVPFRLDGLVGTSDDDSVAGDALQGYGSWTGTMAWDETVGEGWRIEHDGNTYRIIGVPRNDMSWQAHVRMTLERI